jgi:hypothetical protein
MVACDNWTPSLTFRITPVFVPGDYLIKLTAPGNRQSYVPLTIWDPASTATYVIKNDVFTWQAPTSSSSPPAPCCGTSAPSHPRSVPT